jgi:hypothetical protein
MLPLDDILRHCKGIAQPSEPNPLCPVYPSETPYFEGQTEREVSTLATRSDFHAH